MRPLHFELLTSQPLDFRDARSFALTCSASRYAFVNGPLHLITDITRHITSGDITHLVSMLRWCGEALRTLHLDQQPRSLWPRSRHWQAHMAQMPFLSWPLLRAVCRCCPNLVDMAFHGWVAYNGCNCLWSAELMCTLRLLPGLVRVHLPTTEMRGITAGTAPVGLHELLESCPGLTQLSMAIPSDVEANSLLRGQLASRLLQLHVRHLSAASMQLLSKCPQLRRLDAQSCYVGGLDMSSALPATLRVLSLEGCEGRLEAVPFELAARHVLHLEALILVATADGSALQGLSTAEAAQEEDEGEEDEEIKDETLHATQVIGLRSMLLALCTPPHLMVLAIAHIALRDAQLRVIASSCPLLHTLRVPFTRLSAHGFEELRASEALPRLRVAEYENEWFAADDSFFRMQADELQQSLLDALDDVRSHSDDPDTIESATDSRHAARGARAFFAFCTLVATRGLVVPLRAHNHAVLPTHEHPLQRDYFHLGLSPHLSSLDNT